MSGKHFTLDVDPEGLRTVAGRLGDLATTFERRGTRASATPGEIGDRWIGDAATAVTAEMSALGGHLTDFGTRMGELPEALRALARDYEQALDRLPELNRRWEEAEQAYTDAVGAADTALTSGREEARGEDGTVSTEDRQALQRSRDDAVEAARDARHQTQYWLEYEFHHTKVHLAQRTRELGTAMRESGPLAVSDAEIEAWRNGEAPQIDRAPLFDTLVLSRLREVELVTPDVESKVDDLRDALEDGEPEEVQEALEAIGAHADDPVWSQALVDVLGPEGVQELYLAVDDRLAGSTLYLDELWPALEGFNRTVAHGISQLPPNDFAEFLQTWMEEDYGPKMWALVASADTADGRISAAAMAHHSEVYNVSLSDGMSQGLFPTVFHHAYPDEDMLDVWDHRASGEDLADIVEYADPEQIEQLMFRLLLIESSSGTRNQDDHERFTRLWREMVTAMGERSAAAYEEGRFYNHRGLMEVLELRHLNAGRSGYELPQHVVDDLLSDDRVLAQLVRASESGEFDSSALRDLLEDEDVDIAALIERTADLELARGTDAQSIARMIGHMLRLSDVAAEDFEWGGILTTASKEVVKLLAERNPVTGAVTGPVISILESFASEYARLEQLDADLDQATSRNGPQEALAFMLFTGQYGPPDGFEEYVRDNHQRFDPDDPTAPFRGWMDKMEADGHPDWERMSRIVDRIDETRDEQ